MSESEFKKCDVIRAELRTLPLARCVTLGRPFHPLVCAILVNEGMHWTRQKGSHKLPSYYKFYDFIICTLKLFGILPDYFLV